MTRGSGRPQEDSLWTTVVAGRRLQPAEPYELPEPYEPPDPFEELLDPFEELLDPFEELLESLEEEPPESLGPADPFESAAESGFALLVPDFALPPLPPARESVR